MSKDSNEIIGKRFAYMSDPRTKECIEECGEILPCNCGAFNCKEAVMFDCTCECPKHPYPKLDITTLKILTGGDKICVRKLEYSSYDPDEI